MNIDVFVLARLGSSRLPKKHFKEIIGKPAIFHLIYRIKKAKKIRKIIVCTTDLKSDDELVDYLKKENIDVFRGNSNDIIKRILDAAELYHTDIIIDVEGDKIYTDPKYIDIIADEFKKSQLDYITGNDSLTKFNPSHGVHGIIPAGFSVDAIKKMYNLKKTDNTETGYREYFLGGEFKVKYLVPQHIEKFSKNLRLFLDYPEDLEMARAIFKELGNDFDMESLLDFLEKKPEILEITKSAVKLWLENYEDKKTNFI
ncbi:acylneuraminate cytidylyltransferase [Candidatus Nitrosarchaeum limnium SFB1]|jgi:spore coat polysaccharide biosynthesis protein SpsF|uniref:Acylneuraminate cytidylyltransferase n=1 Tax=Candidatus Nitrosarchaeum limnium SFB1 TaxID=886738 RepID=F3KNK0_9ARCH|nr:acylneuraminate cytidylyltransferase [Candidatus Nitrosarchaeum limnium SFB1]